MKCVSKRRTRTLARRSPCGERGLKYMELYGIAPLIGSLPVRGAWVEIQQVQKKPFCGRSLPVRGAWVEIQ